MKQFLFVMSILSSSMVCADMYLCKDNELLVKFKNTTAAHSIRFYYGEFVTDIYADGDDVMCVPKGEGDFTVGYYKSSCPCHKSMHAIDVSDMTELCVSLGFVEIADREEDENVPPVGWANGFMPAKKISFEVQGF